MPPKAGARDLGDTGSSQGTVSLKAVPKPAPPSPPALKLYRCSTAQDGHSFAEDRLYNALWHARQTRVESADSRLITVGWDVMARLAGMTPRNVKENCLRLIQKLAFEKVDAHRSEERIGTTYRILSYNAILERRRRDGLEWITRNRGGVSFVPPPPDGPLLASSRDTVSPESPPSRDTVSSQGAVSVPSKGAVSVSSEGAPLEKNIDRTRQTSSSLLPDSPVIAAAAHTLGVAFDDDAVRKLLRRCRDADPGASGHEIAHFLELKIRQLQRSKSVGNFVGLLIASVPVYFSPPATELVRYREAKAAEARQTAARSAELTAEANRILADPGAAERDKTWARNWIADAAAGEGNSTT